MEGYEIKALCEEAGVKLWRVAEAYGKTPQRFSELLRHSFTEEQTAKLLSIIEELKA